MNVCEMFDQVQQMQYLGKAEDLRNSYPLFAFLFTGCFPYGEVKKQKDGVCNTETKRKEANRQ